MVHLLCTVPGTIRSTPNAITTVVLVEVGTDNIIIINLKELTVQEKETQLST